MHNARWISDSEVVVHWWRDRADGRRIKDLVLLDVDTGEITGLTRGAKPWWFTVDRETDTVAYMTGSRLGVTLLDVRNRELIRGATDAWLPSMSGDHQWP
jgi:hypothetical protein